MPPLNANKTLVAVVGAVIASATEIVLSASSSVTSLEWLHLGVGLAIALGVYQTTNSPKRTKVKATDPTGSGSAVHQS